MTQTNIVVKFQLEGFHCWPEAKNLMPEVAFLSERHRHIFHFRCEKKVTHSDRDVEIILFKRKVINFLKVNYSYKSKATFQLVDYCEFQYMSCEMIAEVLLNEFELEMCEVLEDNENGAVVRKIDGNESKGY